MLNYEKTTDTTVAQFIYFMNFLFKHKLVSKATARLKRKGYEQIRVSLEPIKEIQAMLEEHFADHMTSQAARVVKSIHQ